MTMKTKIKVGISGEEEFNFKLYNKYMNNDYLKGKLYENNIKNTRA